MYSAAHCCAASENSYSVASLAWIRLAARAFTRVFAAGYSFSMSTESMALLFSLGNFRQPAELQTGPLRLAPGPLLVNLVEIF